MSICYDKPRFMKRFLIPVCMLFLLSLISRQSVHAQSPTVASIPMPSGVRAVDAGALNELLDNTVGFAIDATPTGVIKKIPNVNLTTGKDFKVPKLGQVADFFAGGIQFLTPYSIKQKTIDQEQNLYISGRATYYRVDENNDPLIVDSETAYTTEIIPELSTLDQASRFAAAITSRYSISPVDDEYNYNVDREPLEIAKQRIEAESGTGQTQETKTVKTTKGFENFGNEFFRILKSIFGSKGSIDARLASKQLTPYAESMDCLITGCEANGDLSYLKTEEQKRVKESGGIVETYAHVDHKITTGDPNGKEANDFDGATIQTNTLGTKAIENATNYMLCAILPKSKQGAFGVSGKCQQEVTTKPDTTCVTGSLPLFNIDTACKLKKNTFGLSNKMVETIEAAASAYDVPASLILAILYGESALNGNSIYVGSGVDTYLDGCTLIPTCDPKSTTSYKNIVETAVRDWGDVADAVKIVDPARTPNPCNLTDGIFALAKFINIYHSSPSFAGQKCFGIDLLATKDDSKCGSFSDNAAESAIRFWEFGGTWTNNTRECDTKEGTCFSGGQGSLTNLNCNSTDTCETKDNRFSQTSHNGCLWDVYKNN